jgi:hypothetical protein
VKCHSCRSESETGAAWKAGVGLEEPEDNSAVSLRRRRMVGEGAMLEGMKCVLKD